MHFLSIEYNENRKIEFEGKRDYASLINESNLNEIGRT